MKFKAIFCLFFLSFVMFSCNEDVLSTADEVMFSNEDFDIKNGIIYFHSSNAFYKTLEKLDMMDVDQLESWLVENKFHNSLHFKMKEMEECGEITNDGLSLAPGDIADQSFAALLNSNGIVSVGDTISYLTKHKEYVITNGDLSMVSKIKENRNVRHENVIEINTTPPELKGTYTQYKSAYYIDEYSGYYIRINRRISIYFWNHTSNVEVELVNADGRRQEMVKCFLNVKGEFCSNDKDDNCNYQEYIASKTVYERKSNDVRVYRNTGTYGFCTKNIIVTGTVKYKNKAEDSYECTFDSDICYDIE